MLGVMFKDISKVSSSTYSSSDTSYVGYEEESAIYEDEDSKDYSYETE
jgi:hypothetical protein